MKKVVIWLEGDRENEKALALAYAAEQTLNETHGVEGMVQVKSLRGINWLRWFLVQQVPAKCRALAGGCADEA